MSEASETAPEPQPKPRRRLLRIGWLCVSVCELTLAFSVLNFSVGRLCPSFAAGGSCAPLIRPRLADLGPLTVSQLAVLGAAFTLCCCLLAALDKVNARLRTPILCALGAGAGVAVALQGLSLTAAGAVCPLCLALAGISVALALGLTRALGGDLRKTAAAFGVALLLAAPLAVWRGRTIADQDAARRAAVTAAGGERGPRLVLVTREGCPYCDAFELDVLGDPAVLDLLAKTRGVERVGIRSREASKLRKLPGAPTLVALDAEGDELGRIEGLESVEAVSSWLRERTR